MEKEQLSLAMSKLIITVSLIVCVGALFGVLGYFLAMPKSESQNYYLINTSDQKIQDYYNSLGQKCASDSCCPASLKTMKENNYREADEDRECPENFKKNTLICATSLNWCEPMENNIDPMFYCDSKEDCTVVNFDCGSCECDLKAINKNYKDEICKDFTGEHCDKACQLQDYECDNHNCVILNNQPDTSDWQTFDSTDLPKNRLVSSDFQYPSDWEVKEAEEQAVTNKDEIKLAKFSVDFLVNSDWGDNIVELNRVFNYYWDLQQKNADRKFPDSPWPALLRDKAVEKWTLISREEIKLLDRPSLQVIFKDNKNVSKSTLIYTPYRDTDMVFQLELLNYNDEDNIDKVLNQILSTFKFTEK